MRTIFFDRLGRGELFSASDEESAAASDTGAAANLVRSRWLERHNRPPGGRGSRRFRPSPHPHAFALGLAVSETYVTQRIFRRVSLGAKASLPRSRWPRKFQRGRARAPC